MSSKINSTPLCATALGVRGMHIEIGLTFSTKISVMQFGNVFPHPDGDIMAMCAAFGVSAHVM